MTQQDRSSSADDRLICVADALALVPFSATTLRRAIARGELEAWQPNRAGNLVICRSALITWATPAGRRGMAKSASRGASVGDRHAPDVGAAASAQTPMRSAARDRMNIGALAKILRPREMARSPKSYETKDGRLERLDLLGRKAGVLVHTTDWRKLAAKGA